jgi:hypothetical protein
MNTVKLPTQMQSASMSRVAGTEMSALDMLGNQLVLDPVSSTTKSRIS